jgi:hypothetical protein
MSPEQQFRKRLAAVSYYLRSLRDLEERHKKPGRGFYRASATIAASRAAAFIMIYNCVEFAVREAVISTRQDIRANEMDFTRLLPYWREELLRVHFRDRLEQGTHHLTLLRDFDTFIPGKINWLAKERELPFSGNIDHETLLEFAARIGQKRWKPPRRSLGGSDLKLVKNARNDLAHGDETFEDIGGQYETSDISNKLGRIKEFICSFIRMIERYRSGQLYRSA